MARKHLRSPLFLCVTETESMATVCLTQVPTAHHWCVAVTYTRSTGVAPNTNITLVANGLVLAERERHTNMRGQGGVDVGEGGEGGEGAPCRRKSSGEWAAEGAANRENRQQTDTRYNVYKGEITTCDDRVLVFNSSNSPAAARRCLYLYVTRPTLY